MNRFKYLMASAFLFLSTTSCVNAATCGYEEKALLNNETANVKANYEIKERIMDPSEYTLPDAVLGTPEEETYVAKTDYFQVNILNLTEHMYVEVSNNVDKTKQRYEYNTQNKGNISLPRFNKYSDYSVCGVVPDYYLCQKYVTFEDVEFDDFATNVTKEIEKQEEEQKDDELKWYQRIGKFISEHKVIFITGGIILVVVAGGATYIIRKRRRDII